MTFTRADLGIWLINLDRDTDRRAAMAAQLEKLGLSYVRFAAINGKENLEALSKRADADAYARNMGSPILRPAICMVPSFVLNWFRGFCRMGQCGVHLSVPQNVVPQRRLRTISR